MDVNFPILTYIIFLPVLGAVLTYAFGSSVRAAKAIALVFSLITLGLGSLLLVGFLWPDLIGLFPTTIRGPNPLNTTSCP